MKKTRLIGMILAHVGILLSIVYLIFFLVCTVRTDRTAAALNDPEASVSAEDKHLLHATQNGDFSIMSIVKALSEKDDPHRDMRMLALDLVIPLLFLVSGILLQLGSVHKKKTRAAAVPRVQYETTSTRRQP